MKTYEIRKEGDDWNIYYFDVHGNQETKEFWSSIGENTPADGVVLKEGYTKKT
jgi:hypothetical protein